MTDDPPRFAGWILPKPGNVGWATVVGSVFSYFVFSRAVANVVAIIGAVALTAVLVARDRSKS